MKVYTYGPRLDVVSRFGDIVRHAELRIPKDTIVVAVQHLVATTVTLFESLLGLGLDPQHTFVLGKGYSTSVAAAEALRSLGVSVFPNTAPVVPGRFGQSMDEQVFQLLRTVEARYRGKNIKNLIVIDDGGRLLAAASKASVQTRCTIGVEQTTSGVRRLQNALPNFPIVDVARSAAKLKYESPLIAEAIVNKLKAAGTHLAPGMIAGVVGMGSVGKALAARLANETTHVIASDLPAFRYAGDRLISIPELLAKSDVVFGCTGVDIFAQVDFPTQHKSGLVLCSCSSEDVEFLQLLRRVQNPSICAGWPSPDLQISGRLDPVTIVRGGYPVNFDSTDESVPSEDIQITTALIFAGIVTAAKLCQNHDFSIDQGFIQLPAAMQNSILREWFEIAPSGKKLRQRGIYPDDAAALARDSEGLTIPSEALKFKDNDSGMYPNERVE